MPVGVGTMAAILGVEPKFSEICAEAAQGEVVSPANYNSPGQIVIAGNTGAVNRAIEIAKARGFRKAMLLPVSAPFHCALMAPAGDRLAGAWIQSKCHAISTPVVTNVEGLPNSDASRVKALLVEQVAPRYSGTPRCSDCRSRCQPFYGDRSGQSVGGSGKENRQIASTPATFSDPDSLKAHDPGGFMSLKGRWPLLRVPPGV